MFVFRLRFCILFYVFVINALWIHSIEDSFTESLGIECHC